MPADVVLATDGVVVGPAVFPRLEAVTDIVGGILPSIARMGPRQSLVEGSKGIVDGLGQGANVPSVEAPEDEAFGD